VATEEVYRAVVEANEADLSLQQAQARVARARRERDAALQRQRDLSSELDRIERSLNLLPGGQTTMGGAKQDRFQAPGGRESLLARRKELRGLLTARPDRVPPPLAVGNDVRRGFF